MKLIILLFIGLLLSQMHGIIYFFWPETADIELSLFLDKSYTEKITVLWYMYELGNIMDRIIWAFVLCKIAGGISKQWFYTGLVFVAYNITQFGFYLWNRNTSYIANIMNYIFMACVFILILLPARKTGKYITMD